MNAVLTNRLVGSAILLIAAVVFLPDLLDGQKEINKDNFKAIPERPEFAKVSEPVTFSEEQHQAAKEAATAVPTETDPAPLNDLPSQDYASVTTQDVKAQPDTNPQPSAPAQELIQTASKLTPSTKNPEPTVKNESLPVAEANIAVEQKASAEKVPSKGAYMVKVGSFGKAQNADALVAKLKSAGFTAFTRNIVSSQGTPLVSVLVGPELKKEKLEARLNELKTLAQVQNLKVVSYQVSENN